MCIRPRHLLVALIALSPLPGFAADSCGIDQLRDALLQRNQASADTLTRQSAPAAAALALLQAKVTNPSQSMASQLTATDMSHLLDYSRQIRVATASRALELNQDDEIQALTALLQASDQLKAAAAAWLASHGTLEGFSATAALDTASAGNLHLLATLMQNWRRTQADADPALRAAIGSLTDRPTREALTQLTGVDGAH